MASNVVKLVRHEEQEYTLGPDRWIVLSKGWGDGGIEVVEEEEEEEGGDDEEESEEEEESERVRERMRLC